MVTGDVSLQSIPEAAQAQPFPQKILPPLPPPNAIYDTRGPPFVQVYCVTSSYGYPTVLLPLPLPLQLEELTQIVKSVKALKRQLIKA